MLLETSFDAWQFPNHPEWAAAIVIFAVGYLWATRVFHVPGRRRACFLAGLAVLAAGLLSPIEHVAIESMLSFHLLQNVMLADWAPPLLILGFTAAMAAASERHRWVRVVTHPGFALTYWLAVWYVVHVPAVYDYALENRWALGVEHLLFISAGLAFWWPVIVPGRMAPTPKLVYLAVAFFVAAPVAAFIALATSPLYPYYDGTPHLFGQTPLEDQQIGGMLMAVEQSILLFVAFTWTFFAMLRDDERAPETLGAPS
ncbi:MAG: putative rane protein [Gaiellales bacterium]|jgi:putative membrane protein|nr:putative rane protein [Gaiellales bacterium]